VEILDTLDKLGPENDFGEIAEQVVETHGSHVRSDPLQHASLTLAADTVTRGLLELTLVADEPPEDWYDTLANRYLAPTSIYWRPLDEDETESWLDTVGLAELPAVWDRRESGGEQMVYACRAQTCSPPRTELTRALNWAERIL
jgi:Highly conserved protein containing a thioredoxin domain